MKINDLLESYNTKMPLTWTPEGTSKRTTFSHGDESYDIVIGYYTLTIPGRSSPEEVQEVSFGRYVNGIRTVALTRSEMPIKVLSIIYNGVFEEVMKERPGFVLFSAKLQNDANDPAALNKRVSHYVRLAQMVTAHGVYDYVGEVIDSQYAKNVVLVRHDLNITPEEISQIKQQVSAG